MDIEQTELGDIVAVAGVEGITIGETITSVEDPAPLPRIVIDEPTIAMQFTVNTSPFAGREGRALFCSSHARIPYSAFATTRGCAVTLQCQSRAQALSPLQEVHQD